MYLSGLLLLLLTGSLFGVVLSEDIRINSVDELIKFSNDVNSGKPYNGTTVYLESDVDFTGKEIEPIGNNNSNSFRGTFDGQGHIVSNLKIESSQGHVGLFGYTEGATIKNIIMDSSCSIVSSSNSSNPHIGGIVGYCQTNKGPCSIKNSINMGNVLFEGNATGSLYLGGILGRIYFEGNAFTISNCINHASITFTGIAGESHIGGIAGYSRGGASSFLTASYRIINCLNYGIITHNSISTKSYVGGIAGGSSNSHYCRCVNGGEIINTTSVNSIKDIVAAKSQNTNIDNCYSLNEILTTKSSQTIINTTIINELNNSTDHNKWITNIDNKSITFNFGNHGRNFTLSSQLILLPDLYSGWTEFSGWFTNNTFETPFATSTAITEDTTLYGKWDEYLVSLDVNGGDELNEPEKVINTTNEPFMSGLPEPTRTGYNFIGWFTDKTNGELVIVTNFVSLTYNQTLYAHWIINNYTVTFDFDNGTEIKKTFEYNETIEFPKGIIERDGYIFNKWNITKERMPAENITIKVLWIDTNNSVKITFGTKDLSESDISGIISQFTDDDDYIIKIIGSDEDGTTVIIKFNDINEAKNFVEIIEKSSNLEKLNVKRVNFLTDIASFSTLFKPLIVVPILFVPYFILI